MDFLKKHYEKLLLGVVLVGLVVVVMFLLFKVAAEKQQLEDLSTSLTHPRVKLLTNLDLTGPEKAFARLAVPALIDLSTTNRLFNPMAWQQTRETPPRLIRAEKTGPTAATVTNIAPLYLKITLDSVTLVPDGPPKYVIGVQKEAAPTSAQRLKKPAYCKVGDKTDTFKLEAVNGPPDNPTNLVLTLNDSGERVLVSKEQPFRRVDGYIADIRYDPEKLVKTQQRVGANLHFNGEDYKIASIAQTEVILSAPNTKHWTIKANAPP